MNNPTRWPADPQHDPLTVLHPPLFDHEHIALRVEELAAELTARLTKVVRAWDQPPLVVSLLCGAVPFTVDLCRHLPGEIVLRFLDISSYSGASRGEIIVDPIDRAELIDAARGRHVVVLDDIADSGQTLAAVGHWLQPEALSYTEAVLLARGFPPAEADPRRLVGFYLPEGFVVGYGLDFNGRFRHLRAIHLMKIEAYQPAPADQ